MTRDITTLVAIKNEYPNIRKCLHSLKDSVQQIIVIDSNSTDGSQEITTQFNTDLHQFPYSGGYPKKRQWALDNLNIQSSWVLLLDADEVIPETLWQEIELEINKANPPDAFFITKGFHFLGKRFRFGGFSFPAILLFRRGKARFEELIDDDSGLDMEVHERLIVDGRIGKLNTPLIHDDFKGLQAYIDRHNKYSSWEAKLRHHFLKTGQYGKSSIKPKFFGNSQERRRWIKRFIIRLPFEPLMWFAYHYFLKLGFLEGRRGWIASRIRANYIADVRSKVFELKVQSKTNHDR